MTHWNSPGAQRCRSYLREWAQERDCATYDDLAVKVGKNWAYQFYYDLLRLRSQEQETGSEFLSSATDADGVTSVPASAHPVRANASPTTYSSVRLVPDAIYQESAE